MKEEEILKKQKEYMKELFNRRIDIKTDKLLRSTTENDNKETFYFIKPKEEIKNVSISTNGKALMLCKSDEFKIVVKKDFDYTKDEKLIIFSINGSLMKVFLLDKFVEIEASEDLLFINIVDDSDDLISIKNGNDVCSPRVETKLLYKGDRYIITADLYYDVENKPITIFNHEYIEEIPLMEYKEINDVFNSHIDQIIQLLQKNNLCCFMDGSICRIDSYNTESEHVQLSQIKVICNDTKVCFDQKAVHLLEFLKSKITIVDIEGKDFIFNNVRFSSNYEIDIDESKNISPYVSFLEELYEDLSTFTAVFYSEVEDEIKNQCMEKVVLYQDTLDENLKLPQVSNIAFIYNYGYIYDNKISYYLESIINAFQNKNKK